MEVAVGTGGGRRWGRRRTFFVFLFETASVHGSAPDPLRFSPLADARTPGICLSPDQAGCRREQTRYASDDCERRYSNFFCLPERLSARNSIKTVLLRWREEKEGLFLTMNASRIPSCLMSIDDDLSQAHSGQTIFRLRESSKEDKGRAGRKRGDRKIRGTRRGSSERRLRRHHDERRQGKARHCCRNVLQWPRCALWRASWWTYSGIPRWLGHANERG